MKKVILLAVIGGACGVSLVAAHIIPRTLKDGPSAYSQSADGQTRVSDQSVNSKGAHRLVIDVPIGRLVLVADGSGDLTVHSSRSSKRPSDEPTSKWLNDSFITAENKNGVLTVKDHPFGSDQVWHMFENDTSGSNHGEKDLDLKIEVHVPASLAANVTVSAGEANVSGNFKSLSADLAAGNLVAQNIQCQEKLNLQIGAGELDTRLNNNSHGASLHVGAGEVKLSLPAGASADISASVGTGDISGLPKSSNGEDRDTMGDQRRGQIGGGEQRVDISVGTGSVRVESGDKLRGAPITNIRVEAEMREDEFFDQESREMPIHLRHTVNSVVRHALSDVKQAMKSVDKQLKYEFRDDETENFEDVEPTVKKALSKIGPAVHRALRTARPEISRAIHQAEREIERVKRDIDAPEGL